MATDKPNHSRTGCVAEGDVFERDRRSSVVGRDMNSDCKLLHGDCLEQLKKLEAESVDMVLADLPYGTTACKWDNIIPFEPLWAELHRVCKPNAAMCMFGSEPFSSALRMSNIKRFKYDWIWKKSNPSNVALANKQPMKYHETISIFCYGKIPYFKQMIPRNSPRISQAQKTGYVFTQAGSEQTALPVFRNPASKYSADLKNPSSVIEVPSLRPNAKEFVKHPTQKPVALLEYLIKTYTEEGQTVLDPTMGSGSTGVACANLNRKFIGIEMDADYFAIAKRRIDACNLQAESK